VETVLPGCCRSKANCPDQSEDFNTRNARGARRRISSARFNRNAHRFSIGKPTRRTPTIQRPEQAQKSHAYSIVSQRPWTASIQSSQLVTFLDFGTASHPDRPPREGLGLGSKLSMRRRTTDRYSYGLGFGYYTTVAPIANLVIIIVIDIMAIIYRKYHRWHHWHDDD